MKMNITPDVKTFKDELYWGKELNIQIPITPVPILRTDSSGNKRWIWRGDDLPVSDDNWWVSWYDLPGLSLSEDYCPVGRKGDVHKYIYNKVAFYVAIKEVKAVKQENGFFWHVILQRIDNSTDYGTHKTALINAH